MTVDLRSLMFVLGHVGVVGVIALLSYLFGRRLTRGLEFVSPFEAGSCAIALGLGLIAYLVFLAGMLGLLYRPVIITLLMVVLLVCYPSAGTWASCGRRMPNTLVKLRRNKALAFGVGLAILMMVSSPVWLLPFYPPTAFDATSYHLPVAKEYVASHGLVLTPYLRFAVFTQTNHMLFTLALLFHDDISAQLIQFLMLLTLAAGVVAFGQRAFSHRVGWWATAFLLANPIVLWLGAVAYIDIALMLFVTMSVLAYWNWYQQGRMGWLVVAGVFCGLGIGTKYPALFFLLTLAAATIYRSLRQRDYRTPIVFVGSALLVALPWFLRNMYYTGNPIYPFFYRQFGEVFGYRMLRPEYYAGMFEDIPHYGFGKSLAALLWLPWRLTFNPAPFVSDFASDAPLSKIYLFSTPVLFAAFFRCARVRALLVLCAAYALFWFFSIQVLRYLVPILPLLSLASAAAIEWAWSWMAVPRAPWARQLCAAALILLVITPGWMFAASLVRELGPPPVDQPGRDAYLAARLPSYPAYKLLNETRGSNYAVYTYQDEQMAYFAKGRFMGDYFGPARYALILDKIAIPGALKAQLRQLGADYVLVNSQRAATPLSSAADLQGESTLLYAAGHVSLFGIGDAAPAVASELLLNPGFELLADHWPVGWTVAGRPEIDASGKHSHSGSVAARCQGDDNVLFQVVPVTSGHRYALSYNAMALTGHQLARLQVNWSDAQERFLQASLKVIEVARDWRPYQMQVVAPPAAVTAVVYVACHEGGTVWFDDYSFRHIE